MIWFPTWSKRISKDFNVRPKENPIIKKCSGVNRQNSKSL